MATLGGILILVGAVIAFIFGIILLIQAFQESVLWGLGYIFVPFVSLVFIAMHWDKTKAPFLKALIAIPFYVIGFALVGTEAAGSMPQ